MGREYRLLWKDLLARQEKALQDFTEAAVPERNVASGGGHVWASDSDLGQGDARLREKPGRGCRLRFSFIGIICTVVALKD